MASDVVVVGAGSAGCVVAAHLSADPDRRVVLVEAGPDYPSQELLPADIADGSAPTTSHDWGLVAVPDGPRAAIALPRARVVGGCSATNGGFWMRGWPADYDAWAAAGNPGWAFEDLLPLFRGVEADADFPDEWHGSDGPVPVQRIRPDDLETIRGRSSRPPSPAAIPSSRTTTGPGRSASARCPATCGTASG